MSWSIINYECLLDKDEYSIITVKIKEINIYDSIDNHYLEDTEIYINNLRKTYKTKKCLTRQFTVDFPRILCYINNIKIKNIKEFVREIRHTSFLNEAIMICTQSSIFPITQKLFEEFRDIKKDIHVTDYHGSNPLIYNFKIFNKNHISVNIEKKFGIIQVINGNPHILKILKTNTVFEMNKNINNSKNIKKKGVFYTITEIKNNT